MNESALWVQFEKSRFVLGMEWRLLDPTEKLVRGTLRQLRKEGLKWYATLGPQDFVGTCSHISQAQQPLHSAALHLADQWSQGGLELFAFGMPEQRVAVVALNNGRPVPGFDFIGTMTEAQALIEEFEAIEEGQLIRRVGDLGLLADEEKLSAPVVFDQPSSGSRLKQIPSMRTVLILIGAMVLGLAALAGIYQWQIQERSDLLANLPQPGPKAPPDPNPAYDQQTNQLLQSLPAQGHAQYLAWVLQAQRLPLNHQGWTLTQLECKADKCVADWKRDFGSVQDFFDNPPARTHHTQHLPNDKDALGQRLQSQHLAVAVSPTASYTQINDLPSQADGFRAMSSLLQDLSLLGGRELTVSQAQLWGAGADAAALKRPVFKGNWSAELPLGVAAQLVLPPFASVSLLKTTMGPSYQLSGEYLVRPNAP
jgi:hypothetical protein